MSDELFLPATSSSREFRQGQEGEYLAWRPPATSISTQFSNAPLDTVNNINGNSGRQNGTATITPPIEATAEVDPSILPDGEMSLSGISVRAFFLGVVLGISSIITIILLIWHTTPLWRIPFFVSSLCLFHFLEFWVTAQYNTQSADVYAFLLNSNGAAYNIAHGSAIVECFVSHYWFSSKSASDSSNISTISLVFVLLGIVSMVIGQIVRTLAMATAGSNFNHIVQVRRREGHVLVTGGIYGLLRHPSYFGFFWWGLGSQLVLQNFICFIGYAVVLWRFFKSRIYRK